MAKKFKQRDYVRGLITGRWVQVKDKQGKITEVFEPLEKNEHLPLKHLLADTDKSVDDIMVEEALRAPRVNINTEEFFKPRKVKKYLKFLKREHNREVRAAGFNPKTRLNVSDPMYLRK